MTSEFPLDVRKTINDMGYAVAQAVGEQLDRAQVGTQEWRNDVYLQMEGQIPDLIVECIEEAGPIPLQGGGADA